MALLRRALLASYVFSEERLDAVNNTRARRGGSIFPIHDLSRPSHDHLCTMQGMVVAEDVFVYLPMLDNGHV
jgi:hypothetical protein